MVISTSYISCPYAPLVPCAGDRSDFYSYDIDYEHPPIGILIPLSFEIQSKSVKSSYS